jgi:hypothetical protein
MHQKEDKFTGFVAHYGKKKTVLEKENYLDKKTGQKKATNWSEIDKDKLTALELLWHGESKIKIDKKDHPYISSDDWFFTQTAYFDMTKQKIAVVGRNIGYKKDGVLQVYTVVEETGILKSSIRNG